MGLLLFVALVPPGFSQGNTEGNGATHGAKRIRAVRTELPVAVDGSLDDPAWERAEVSLGFLQRDPREGEPSTERTEFRVLYTPTTLYVGVVCYDSNAAGILATERRRDGGTSSNTIGAGQDSLENDDTVALVFDTFHDHRNAFLFRTNPLGTQYDALITDEGRTVNKEWDEQWNVASQITSAGWIAEFAIPFKILRVYEENGAGWGLDVERVIRRKNEFSYWNNYRRGFKLETMSQAGHMEGLENVVAGLRLRVKPYVLGGLARFSDGSRDVTRNASDAGIEVMKYRLTPSLTADLTWRTDFAQTEVDDQQVNLDRFPLFFPEKREFFQEGAGVYEFGITRAEGPNPAFKMFHSRQIGLSPRRRPVPIVAGGRITGRVKGLTVGLLNVQTEELGSEFDDRTGRLVEQRIPASNYGVMRVKRDLLARSTVGGFVMTRESGGTGDFNRIYGVDSNFVFFRYFAIEALLGKSSSPGSRKDNWVSTGNIGWNSDFFQSAVTWIVVDPEFRNDLGFVPRKNMRQITPLFGLRPRPSSDLIRRVNILYRGDYTMNQKNELETRINHYTLGVEFQSGDQLNWTPHTRLERLLVPFQLRPGVVIPPGTYSWWYNSIRYNVNPARRLSGVFVWQRHYGFFGGDLSILQLQPRLKLTEQLSIETQYDLNRATFLPGKFTQTVGGPLSDREGRFTDHVVNTRINYNFNNQWLTSTTMQYNNTDSFLGFNFRLNYIFRPGDDFFLVYHEGRRVGGLLDGQKERSLQAKLTYSFDY